MIKRILKSGFSVVEMSIVLIIVGLILTFSIDYLGQSARNSAIEKTQAKLDKIEDALRNYVDINGYLPCPAKSAAALESEDYGISTPCNGSSTGTDIITTAADSIDIRVGVLPTRTLGLSDQDMLDSWGNRFTYAVVENLAYDVTVFKDFITSETTGVIQITDAAGNQLTQAPDTCDGATDEETCPVVAYLLLSHGSDERGAYNRDGDSEYEACGSTKKDSENCNGDEVFISTAINDGEVLANYYDDIVRWKLKNLTMSMANMIPNYELPPPYFTFKTTSSLASFNPTAITFPDSDLVWTCTDCVPVTTGSGNTPNLDLSGGSNPAEKTIRVESSSAFEGFTNLSMANKNITSFFEESDRGLRYLTDLYLNSNQITVLGDDIGNIGSLGDDLYRVYFHDNSLTTLPATIGNWIFDGRGGTILRFNDNDLTELPDEIGNITGLAGTLYVSNNNLTTFPSTIGGLTTLTDFYAQSNSLASLPDEIGNIGSAGDGLYRVYFHDNSLTTLPTTIGNWIFDGGGGTILRFDSNTLTELPDEIGNITGLAGALYIDSNDLTTLPSTIGGLTTLSSLYAQSNPLTSLPDEIGNIGSAGSGLYRVYFQGGNLTTLPTTIGNWIFDGGGGTILRLDDNDLTDFPDEIADITGIDGTIYLDTNEVTSVNFENWIDNLYDTRATSNLCSGADTPTISIGNSATAAGAITAQTYDQIEENCAYTGFNKCSFTSTYSDPGGGC